MVDIFPARSLPGQQAENWGRAVEDRIISLESGLKTATQNSDGDNRSIASQIQQLTNLVNAIPVVSSGSARAEGFGISGGYVTYTTANITVPAGKTIGAFLCVGSGAALDATTGGLTTAYGRCVINGSASGEFPAAKDHGSSAVNNVITATQSATIAVSAGQVIAVSFQMYGLNGSAFPARPSNFAQISVVATFS